MKLLNHTTKYLLLLLLPLITFWAIAFYYAMLNEINNSLDYGLENKKTLLIQQIKEKPSILQDKDFKNRSYTFNPISEKEYLYFKERYRDTLMYIHNETDLESARILESSIQHQNQYYNVKIATSMVEENNLISNMLNYLIGLYLLLIISVLLLNTILLKKIWKPFYHAIAQLKNFKIEKEKTITTIASSIDEFELLNKTITKLIKKSSHSYVEQKQFLENASHDLQTPLSVSINKLKLFIKNNPLNQNQTEALTSVLDNLDSLTRLNKSLLLLSNIENKEFLNEELINFSELTKKIIRDFDEILKYKNMSVNFENNSVPNIRMNKELANILLINFIKNAIVHGNSNSNINILLENNLWSITNTGHPEPLNQNYLFTRFKNVGNSKKTTGLGLAINKAIAAKYDLQLSYNFNDLHTFFIHFP